MKWIRGGGVGIFILLNCIDSNKGLTQKNTSILYVEVIDENTKKPVEKAIVYLGTGYWKSYTDRKGRCSIKDFPFGEYSFSVFKKGYERFTKNFKFKIGENYLKIELKKKEKEPESITIKGKIVEIVTNKGTRSENHYFKIIDEKGNEEYIFNEIGENKGFENMVNKKVIIKGFREKGFIGWEHKEVDGIYVEKINEE